MQDADPEARFLTAIARAAASRLGDDHPLVLAARAAAANRIPAKAAYVHELLAALDDADRDGVLADAHREMREDFAAIRGLLPGGQGGLH